MNEYKVTFRKTNGNKGSVYLKAASLDDIAETLRRDRDDIAAVLTAVRKGRMRAFFIEPDRLDLAEDARERRINN